MDDTSAPGRLLPHRHPMLLVDRVVVFHPPDRLVTVKAVTVSEWWYGTTDTAGPYPPALIVESFAQSCGLLWRYASAAGPGRDDDRLLVLGSAQGLVFHAPVRPGSLMRHEVRLEAVVGGAATLSGETWVDDLKVATMGRLVAALRAPAELA